MAKPAARIGDMHTCPKVTPGTGVPHVGGVIIGPGCGTVLIEGLPAATVGDVCACVGEADKVVTGSSSVYIGGMPTARMNDLCAHGGNVSSGSSSVIIGGGCLGIFPPEDTYGNKKKFVEPSIKHKIRLINQAIADTIRVLEHKIKLLSEGDNQTMECLTKWFGQNDDNTRKEILARIKRALEASKTLTAGNFDEIIDEKDRREICATAYPDDYKYRFKIGTVFWKATATGKDSKSSTIIHELSHFANIGGTQDVMYGENGCFLLAKQNPDGALKNATSFEYFVTT
ncbi:M35 family metallo-endopeptidase [Niastella populi]|uniref:Lysine-specific metallo-endopeptidase domain-containing protein n=1 Tax=Niastella populi TaxID=550983 RepID=A0A1V9F573_9BACT|nr:M35 family metallo-endopeptidase [Niastella populi]OQP53560.1 hypothetical protein A4R26_06170 [Niastella populi]